MAPHPIGRSGFLLEETDCGSSRDALDTNTDLFEAKTIECFLQHYGFVDETIVSKAARSMSVLLNSPINTRSEAKRALLSERLQNAAKATIPLSFAQQRLWFLDQVEPNSSLYSVPTIAKMRGTLNVEALRHALDQIVSRHESLRTRFVDIDGNPTQVVDSDLSLEFEICDLGAEISGSESAVHSLIRAEVNRPFDLRKGPLIRARLIRVAADEHWFVLNMHHIVSDEWSLRICFQEMGELYTSRLEARDPDLPQLSIQYADYTRWQRDWLSGEVLEEQLSYWQGKLAGSPPVLELATDHPRPAMQTFRGGIQKRVLPAELGDSLTQLGARNGSTLFMVTLAAFKVLLRRYTQQDDIVVGSPITGRTLMETEPLIGFFVNTLLLRSNASGDPTFGEFLGRVRETTLSAYAHGDMPLEKLVEKLHPERATTHTPFARIMFALQNTVLERLEWPGLALEFVDPETETAKFDLTVVLQVSERGLVAQAEYNRDLFEPATMDRLLEHFEILLKGIAENPQHRLSELPLLSEREHQRVLIEWNETKTTYPRDECIHELFASQVEKNPNRRAVVFGKQSLSYQELNQRANRLANYLKRFSVGPDVLIGICMERSVEMIVTMLAVLKAGGAYVPIEAGYPRERLTFMLADSGAPLVLTQQRLLTRLPKPVNALCVDSDWELIAGESRENVTRCANAADLAYVIYTSGSTGTPKGVGVPHRAINRLVLNTNYVQLTPGDHVGQISNASFDAATFEIWGALLNGGTLIGIERDAMLSPREFAHELREQNISTLFLTTALFNQVVAEVPDAFATVRTLMFGGESADPKSVARVLKSNPPRRLLNVYGPTENTTFSTYHELGELSDDVTNVPIGQPISNSQCFILDAHLNPMPIGVPGEVHVGGDGLARGYWNRPGLTAQKFIQNPFRSGEMLYKTGDLARWLPDGRIEFLGRMDQQIKIRGFRIELGEIEIILSRHPAVRECVATSRKGEHGYDRLVAYFVPQERVPSFAELMRFLKDRVPEYMLPSAFVSLDALPLTPNGKVDRGALPDPGEARPLLEGVATPRDAVELKLTQIWENVLNVRPIGIEDKFFDLGGHSLLAVKLISQIEKVFGRRLRVATVFQAPTIERLSAIIREETQEGSALAGTSLVEIQSQGSRPPLFLVHGAGSGMFWGYVNLSRHLGTDQPVYGLKSRGLDGGEEFENIRDMAAQYVADVRALQPHGPYHIGGYCFGGNVAFEMARQFQAQGEEVALLALLNCSPPNSSYDRISWTPAWFVRFGRNLLYWMEYFRHWTPPQRREYIRWKKETLKQQVARILGRNATAPVKVDAGNLVDLSSFPADQRNLWRNHIDALLKYHPEPYSGRVNLFRSPGHPVICSFQSDYGWGELAEGGVDIAIVPGVHEKILEEPCVGALAEELKDRINIISSSKEGVHLPASERDQLTYWKQMLMGASTLLELPSDRPRPAQRGGGSAIHSFSLSPEVAEVVRRLSEREANSPSLIMLGAFQILLSRYTGATDIVVGCAVNRGMAGIPAGAHGNIIALRADLGGNPSFRTFLGRLRQVAMRAFANATLPFDCVLGEFSPTPNLSYAPIFQVMFDYEQQSSDENVRQHASPAIHGQISNLDLILHMKETPDGLSGKLEYSTDLFDADRIARMAGHFEILLKAAAQDPLEKLQSLPLMPESERRKVLIEWNANEREYPRETTLVQLFEAQAKRTPDAVALIEGEDRISYVELNARANQIAHKLRSLGISSGKLVGICMKRSWRMLAGILGALKAGAAYAPLDPAYPKDRLTFILEDAMAPVLLTEQALQQMLKVPGETRIFNLDSDWPQIEQQSRENPPVGACSDDLAYVIYTSGSTGKPKGVGLEHRNAVALMYWARDVFTSGELAGVLFSTSICFDLSVFEMFVPLSWGGAAILAENALTLPGLPAAREVTLVNTVPSAIRELVRIKGLPSSVRVINLAGEPLITPLVDQIYEQTSVKKVYDLYGPTETTTYSTFTLRKAGEPATIGRPLANEQVYLLDRNLQPVPIGVPGEIYIGGDGVARGYLNRPELTLEKFIANPLAGQNSDIKPGRLYKTGDLARWGVDGNLEFLGRTDHQVKIRGFRIELGEIESVLCKHSKLQDAVVVVREDRPGDKRLAAYVVRKPSAEVNADEIRGFAREALPEYMVPPSFVILEALPLTPNGKVDRKALPVPDQDRGTVGTEFIEPVSTTEQQLAAIWREVLGVECIGANDNFIELGGHSLLAIQVLSRVREKFGAEPPLNVLFDAPTIQEFGRRLDAGEWEQSKDVIRPIQRTPRGGRLPLSSVQERLWFLDQVSPGGHAYNLPLALRLKGALDVSALQFAFTEIVRRHETLRTTFANHGGELSQVIAPATGFDIKVDSLESIPTNEREARLVAWLNTEAQRPFDLACGPLIRVKLCRIGPNDHALSVVMHHAISDGWSQAILFSELQGFYRAFVAKQPAPQSQELPVQYVDFALWQREWMQDAKLEGELAYWKNKLEGAPGSVKFPMDPAVTSKSSPGRAGRVTQTFLPATAEALATFSYRENATPFMALMTALAITFEKWASQKDLVIGTVVAGRTRREVENVIGCFMNFLPIRTEVSDDETGETLLAKIKSTVLEAQAHQDCPFEKIVEAVNPDRQLNQNPLYNVALLLQNFPDQLFEHKDLEVTALHPDLEAAQLDLRFEAEFSGQKLALVCEYNTDLLSANTAEQLLVSYRAVLEKLLINPVAKVVDFAISDQLLAQTKVATAPKLKVAIAATFTAEPLQESLNFWMNQLEVPAKIEFAGFSQVFQELLNPAGLLATNSHGANVVLVRLDDFGDSVDKIQSAARELTSAVKTAATRMSIPLLVLLCPAKPRNADAVAPVEKTVAEELDKLSTVCVVTSAELLDLYPVRDFYDARGDEIGCVPYAPQFFTALGTMVARRFYASQRAASKVIVLDCDQTLWGGVCGEDGPRGVCVDAPRRALQGFMRGQHAAGRLLAVCSKNNEEDVSEVFAHRLDMPLRREHFTTWRLNWQPKSENIKSMAKELNLGLESFIFVDDNPVECAEVAANCPDVLTLQLPENPADIPQFLKHCWAFDLLKVTAEDTRRGEMYRENRQRDELRAQAGNLAEFLAGLNLKIHIAPMKAEQLTRVAQLTHRTNQFNATTIRRSDAEIRQIEARASVLTVSVTDRFGDYGMVGVMVCEPKGDTLDVETFLLSCRVLGRGVEHEMLAHLGHLACEHKKRWVSVHFHPSAKNKPAQDFLQSVGAQFNQALNGGFVYAFPADFAAEVTLNPQEANQSAFITANPTPAPSAAPAQKFNLCRTIALELNDAAKIHQAIESKAHTRSVSQNGYVAPRTETEKQICELWQKLLRIDRVGARDDFFDLGGHSLLAVRLFAELEKVTGCKLPLITIFQAPTVEQLACAATESHETRSRSVIVPVQANGSRPPLFLVHGAGGDVLWGYANLAKYLHPEQPVYGIKSRGQVGLGEFDQIEDMARYYLEQIRAQQPNGPYFLGGYCFGGNIAYEMARQLRSQGEIVSQLLLIDATPSNAGYESIPWWRPSFYCRFSQNLFYWFKDFVTLLEPAEQRRYFVRKIRVVARKLLQKIHRGNKGTHVDLDEVIDVNHFPEHELKFWQIHLNALVAHVERPYAGSLTLLRTRGQAAFCSFEEDFCWGKLAHGGVQVKHIPGSHENIFVEPNVKFLAKTIEECLSAETAPANFRKNTLSHELV
jgi:amino acid adenylation domain-containing protein/FkbH-like protein